MSPKPYKLILGLGNPGKEYQYTYHNAGVLGVLHYIEEAGVTLSQPKGKHFSFAKTDKLIFAIPTTFMNESGIAAKEALSFFKLKPEELCVIHDDSDIELGNYKVSVGRGSAGHHGIDSIVETLKTNSFARIRIGIRPPQSAEAKRKKASEFVLASISQTYLKKLYGVFGAIKENVIEKETPLSAGTRSVSGTFTS